MKRSLLTVCSLLLAAGLVGCAVEETGDDGLPLGESRQDLAVDRAAASFGADEQAPGEGDRPEPEPWILPAANANGAVAPGPGPLPDSDPRRFANDAARAAGGEERPEPEPWAPKDKSSVSLTKNQ